MKNLGLFLVTTSVLFATSAFAQQADQAGPVQAPKQKIQCQWQAPGCFDSATMTGTSDFDLNGLSSPDDEVSLSASLKYSDDQSSSILQMSLTDKKTGKVSRVMSYNVTDGMSLIGGVEKFRASNGKKYSVVCMGTRFSAQSAIDSTLQACPQP